MECAQSMRWDMTFSCKNEHLKQQQAPVSTGAYWENKQGKEKAGHWRGSLSPELRGHSPRTMCKKLRGRKAGSFLSIQAANLAAELHSFGRRSLHLTVFGQEAVHSVDKGKLCGVTVAETGAEAWVGWSARPAVNFTCDVRAVELMFADSGFLQSKRFVISKSCPQKFFLLL